MAKVKQTASPSPRRRERPAISVEAREGQLVSLAVSLAEQQLRDGTASSQVITHYLKLGSMREKLERERLEEENKLLKAKTRALEEEARTQVDYQKVLKALKTYNGQGDADDYSDLY